MPAILAASGFEAVCLFGGFFAFILGMQIRHLGQNEMTSKTATKMPMPM